MEISYKNNINDINVIFKIKTQWYSQYRNGDMALMTEFNISSFLLQHTQFIKITPSKIINLANVTNFVEAKATIFLEQHSFNVSNRYLPFLKIAYSLFKTQRNKELTKKSPSILNVVTFQKRIAIVKIGNIDFNIVKYLLREGIKTKVYYNDGSEHYLYQTLNLIKPSMGNVSFVQISRNCIVNINYINACQIDRNTKIGFVEMNTEKLKISRRLLSGFIHNTLKML